MKINNFTKNIFIPLAVITAVLCISHDVPAVIKKCKRFDPKLNECLLEATEAIKPYLIKGIPELGIPPIEPFTLPEFIVKQGTDAINFKATISHFSITGLSKYKFTQFDFDVPNLQIFCNLSVDGLELRGSYSAEGKILVIPMDGKGDVSANLTHSYITVQQKLKVVKKKNVEYLQQDFINTTLILKGIKVNLDGLFGGNDQIGRATNKAINDNIDDFYQEVRPAAEGVIENVMAQSGLKAFLDNVPFDKLYPKE